MKQIVLNIKDSKYGFFLELIKNLEFVDVQEDDGDSKEEIMANLTQAFKDLRTFKQGQLETTSAKEFLDEL